MGGRGVQRSCVGKRFWVRCLMLWAVLLVPVVVWGVPASGAQPHMLFILDTSGSMWGRIDGRTKIEIARDVLREVLTSLPVTQPAGFMAYGHRRKGDCQDIELLVPVAPGQTAKLAEMASTLQPKGMTPIAEALRVAADGLKFREQSASIILVSDGRETCSGDPCAVAKSLHEAGVDLKVFVVGFDVSGVDATQLRCVAEASGGQYFTAGSASELGAALKAITGHVTQQAPLPAPAVAQAAPAQPNVAVQAAGTKKVSVQSVATIRLEPASWVRVPPRQWKVIDAESGQDVGTGDGLQIRIAPGMYQLAWRQDEHGSSEVRLNTTVAVQKGQASVLPLDTGLRLTAPQNLGAAYFWMLTDENGQEVARFSRAQTYEPQLVPAGRYRLGWRLSEHGSSTADLGWVEIPTGQLVDKVLDTGVTIAVPSWLGQPYRIVLRGADGAEYRCNESGVHPLASGAYSVTWRQTEHGHSDVNLGEIQVAQGAYAPLPVNAGVTFVAPGQQAPYRIVFTNTATGDKAELRENWGPLPLPSGVYTVDMQEKQHGASPLRLLDDLQVEPGQLVEVDM